MVLKAEMSLISLFKTKTSFWNPITSALLNSMIAMKDFNVFINHHDSFIGFCRSMESEWLVAHVSEKSDEGILELMFCLKIITCIR